MTMLDVTLEAMQAVPLSATQPPVILLNGWQFSCPITVTSPPSASTFGNLEDYLTQFDSVPLVYWFDSCQCPDCSIEELGGDLAQTIGSIQYTSGTPVPQVDLIAHSMGGLIVRSYLSGKQQTPGVFVPPANTRVRKAVFIATPHFGSFLADNPIAGLSSESLRSDEMEPGSQFLLNLGTWNQFGDDLRGTDAIAIIGDASSNSESDGVVYLNSASIGFAEASIRTRIVDYCHIDFTGDFSIAIAALVGCTGPGIAYIDGTSHPTYEIIQSFLANTTAWQDVAISATPSQNYYMSRYGGVYFTAQGAGDQYLNDLNPTYFGSVPLDNGAWTDTVFYNEFIEGTASFLATSASLGTISYGPWAIPLGQYTVYHAKLSPAVSSVGPLQASGPGWVVQSGGTITINGVGFGSEQCSTCQVLAAPPGSTTGYLLPVSSWSGGAISASFLPATMPNLAVPGLVTIYVELSPSAWGSINIMTAPAANSIAVAPTSLQFAYTVGGTVPAAQSIQITNSGGGTLNWSATTSATWLSVAVASGTAPSTLSVLVSPTGLGAGTYTRSVQISAAGASNSPVSVAVTLTVAPAPPVLAVSPQALTFNYMVSGTIPAAQSIQVTNSGGGTLNWSATASAMWLSVAVTSGTAPSTLSVLVSPTGLGAGTYTGSVQISAAGASNSPVSVTVTLTVAPAPPVLAVSPQALTFNYTVGVTILAAQSIQVTNSGGGTLNWSATTSATWLTVAAASGTAPSTLSVLVSPTGLGAGTYTGSVQISAAGASNSPVSVAVTLTVAPAPPVLAVSPQALTFNSTVGGTTPAAQGISITNTGGGALSWVASASAAWVGLSPASGTAPAMLSVSANPATLAAGSYSATVLITAAGATGSAAAVSVALVVQTPQPAITGVSVSGGGADIAQNAWVSIYGVNLAPANVGAGLTWSSAPSFAFGEMPTQLQGVSVTVNGKPAYIYFISPAQVNVLTPLDSTTGPVTVEVNNGITTSAAFTANLQAAAPGLLRFGDGIHIAAEHADYILLGPASMSVPDYTFTPATRGETILLFGDGFGLPVTTLMAGSDVQLGALPTWPQVTIGGTAADVQWAGLISPGLYQINVVVPPNAASGDDQVIATYAGASSPTGAMIPVSQ
jgi:uncharacterized protein (TIGR03437 family)